MHLVSFLNIVIHIYTKNTYIVIRIGLHIHALHIHIYALATYIDALSIYLQKKIEIGRPY